MALLVKGFTGSVGQVDFSRIENVGDGVVGSMPWDAALRVDRVVGQDRRVTVQPGAAHVPGARVTSDAVAAYDFPANASGQPRLDWLVLRFSWASDPGTVVLTHVQGTPAGTPQRPLLVQTPGVQWDVPLALVRIDAGVGALPSNAITDARYWDMGGAAVQLQQTVDPTPNPGRLLYLVNSAELLASNGSEYGPVGPVPVIGTLGMASGWAAYGGGFGTPGYRVQDGIVNLSGLVKRTGGNFTLSTTQVQIATIPAAARPVLRRVMGAMADGSTVRLDASNNGVLAISNELAARAFITGGYVSLDGLSYRI